MKTNTGQSLSELESFCVYRNKAKLVLHEQVFLDEEKVLDNFSSSSSTRWKGDTW